MPSRRIYQSPMLLWTTLIASVALASSAWAAGHPAGRPYRGWSSWSLTSTNFPGYGKTWLTAEHVEAQSVAMAARLQDHGYTYINVDADWRGGWDEFGRPTAEIRRFPGGLRAVADRVHARGQKLGIYYVPGIDDDLLKLDRPIKGTAFTIKDIVRRPRKAAHGWGGGNAIDFSRPGANEYIRSIADLFAEWGVDFLKFDGVTPGSDHRDMAIDGRDDVAAWDEAIARTGRPIWLTLSWNLDMKFADFWRVHSDAVRVTRDVESYDVMLTHWPQVARAFPAARDLARSAGRDQGWNDLDSLLVGNGAMTDLSPDERRSVMTLWAIACSPLYSGDDLTKLDALGIDLLTNDEVLAVQEAGFVASLVAHREDGGQVWAASGEEGGKVVALFNLSGKTRTLTASFDSLEIPGRVEVRDLWDHRDLGPKEGRVEVTLPPHACRLFRLSPPGR